jgi:hypothetical protein
LFLDLQSLAFNLIFDWSGWIAMIIFVIWALAREQKWIISQLPDEVANGIITPDQYKTASSASAQTIARLRAFFAGRYRLIDRFYLLTAGLKKHQAFIYEQEQNRLKSIALGRA